MSRPVFEPSLTRQDAAQAWASRQLFRRPAPTGGFIHYMRMWQFGIDTTLDGVSGDGDPLSFDYWEYSDPAYIEPLSVSGGSPPTVSYAQTHERGLYLIHMSLEFDQAIAVAPEAVGIALIEDTAGTYTSGPTNVMPGQPVGGANSTGHYAQSVIRSYPPIWRAETTAALAPSLPEFGMSVAVLSGDATTHTFSAMMEVHLLQEYDYEFVPDTGFQSWV